MRIGSPAHAAGVMPRVLRPREGAGLPTDPPRAPAGHRDGPGEVGR
ncbi:hypothetical protein FNQ90_06370 [Streptomyces alkaliphilus]|uniref:Uncharacterized protein n=1 Tax=Streptomyces alkaliphilus TaxID=1472722 RepID=A0A7W3Y0K0_9ACTN|nr:hypothetical protein [Streptomyces alkaliphilus]